MKASIFNSPEQITAHAAGVALGESCARIGYQSQRQAPTRQQADQLAELLYVGAGCTAERREEFAAAILEVAARQFAQPPAGPQAQPAPGPRP